MNDEEATVLLKWGEGQVIRIAEDFPEDFEKKARFLRQMIKHINRFVGQREFNELEGQQNYLRKFLKFLPELGWQDITEEQLFAPLPEDRADMMGTLTAILGILSPASETSADMPETPEAPNIDIPAEPDVHTFVDDHNDIQPNIGEQEFYDEE